MVVRDKLNELGIKFLTVNLGEVELAVDISTEKRLRLGIALKECGLELMEDKKSELIRRIKQVVIEMIYYMDELPHEKFSDYLAAKLGEDYAYMANLFSEIEAITISQFILLHKVERVKELIIYNKLNLTEIAWKLNYSSVAHLSQQFKKVTGLTPTYFKALKIKRMAK
jgi:AraC-like DNA-binding protein